MDKKHYNITVTGKVQGVYYRQSTKEKAKELGLYGFVRNETNGDVYMEAEGVVEKLEELVQWCWRGPSRAEVKEVRVRVGDFKNFREFLIDRK
ncbi:MAG TPA: acylphosphatase [Bacteroidia bacterium]|jgi:acylphosphatase